MVSISREMDVPVVILSQKGDVKQGKIKGKGDIQKLFATALKKKEAPSLLGRYTWKQKTLFLFGYLEGKAESENQIHLFPPLEGMTFYGDILVVCSNDANSYSQLQPFKVADYESFYTSKMEGEDDDENEELDDNEEIENQGVDDQVDDENDGEESESEDEYGGGDDSESEKDVHSEIEEDESEQQGPPIEKIIRPTRVRKQAIPQTEEPEVDPESKADSSQYRKLMLDAIESIFTDKLTEDEKQRLEETIFQTSLTIANKEQVRKAWGNKPYSDIYMAIGRRICGNLSPNSYIQNKSLWDRYKAGEITFEQIASQNYYEMCPEVWQQMVDRQAKRERIQLEGDFSRATDRWLCNGCKKRKCTYYELQTRSADEPMTIFIQCLNCGKRWTH